MRGRHDLDATYDLDATSTGLAGLATSTGLAGLATSTGLAGLATSTTRDLDRAQRGNRPSRRW